jgi:hypothetical protein
MFSFHSTPRLFPQSASPFSLHAHTGGNGGSFCGASITTMSSQPATAGEIAQDEAGTFSDKVQDRISANAADCCLVSANGTRYPVHKAKLREQSKVLRQVIIADTA